MPCLSRLSRIMLACVLLSAAAWVAMPVAGLLVDVGTEVDTDVDTASGPPITAGGAGPERPRPSPPRHVIRDAVARPQGPGAAEQPGPPGVEATAPRPADMLPPAAMAAVVVPPDSVPLPPLPQAFSSRPPPLDPTYRSTLEIPPPPLLDAHAPPPVSSSRALAEPGDRIASTARGAEVPGEYVVRDGDDLTSIAVKFYGNPAAAEAIWAANRERLPDPRLLPIGLALHLPPMSAAGLPSGRRERVIEPL